MKTVCMFVALVLLVAAPMTLWSAEDGAAVYKAKCSACHGEKGEGKPAVKMPAAKGTKMTAEEIVTYVTKGQSGLKIHAKPVSGVSEEQAKAVADVVKAF